MCFDQWQKGNHILMYIQENNISAGPKETTAMQPELPPRDRWRRTSLMERRSTPNQAPIKLHMCWATPDGRLTGSNRTTRGDMTKRRRYGTLLQPYIGSDPYAGLPTYKAPYPLTPNSSLPMM